MLQINSSNVISEVMFTFKELSDKISIFTIQDLIWGISKCSNNMHLYHINNFYNLKPTGINHILSDCSRGYIQSLDLLYHATITIYNFYNLILKYIFKSLFSRHHFIFITKIFGCHFRITRNIIFLNFFL